MRASDKVLHDALVEAGLPTLAQRAARGEWNDYFGEHDAPQHALLAELRNAAMNGRLLQARFAGLKRRVMGGDFDGTKAESDEWAQSPEGREAFEALRRHGLEPA